MPAARRHTLLVTQLEDRTVPAGSWLDPTNLTVSFAKDGTAVDNLQSSLFSSFGPGADHGAVKKEILRGLQTWASVANVNVGLVRDGGKAFGAAGSIQSDTRFGDIRIGGTPQSANILAHAMLFDWAIGTWSGDMLFNTTAGLGINPTNQAGVKDLYTVALHEAGHALGLNHLADPASVMYEQYTGAKAGLTAGDVAAIQALYGARVPDQYEGTAGNNTLPTATALTGDKPSVSAELTTATDVDYYTYTAPTGTKKFTVSLRTAGLSLLTAKVTVYNAAGKVVGSDAALDPTSGDLAVRVNRVQAGAVYTIKVSANATDAFGVGRYKLGIGSGGEGSTAGSGNDAQFVGAIETTTGTEQYQFTATDQVMMVQLSALQKNKSIPNLTVFNAAMVPVAHEVVGNDGKTLTARVVNVTPGAVYTVQVAGNGTTATKGNFALTVDFIEPVIDGMTNLHNSTLSSQAPISGGTLTLHATSLFHFVVDTGPNPQPVPAGTSLTLTVFNSAGQPVLAKSWSASQSLASYTAYLAAGTYTVQIGLITTAAGAGAVVDIWLDGGVYSDPVGTAPPGTGTTPPTGGTTTTTDPITGIVTTTTTTTDATTGITTTTVNTFNPSTGATNTVITTVSTVTTTDPITGVTTTTTTTTTTDVGAGTTTTTTTTTTSVASVRAGFSFDPWATIVLTGSP